MKRVYVAGPYTHGDVAVNVKNAVNAANVLLWHGHAPYVPHLTHFWHMMNPCPYEMWLRLDFEWLVACHALIRLPGESPGADREVVEASRLGIPVYAGIQAFIDAESS